MYFENNRRTCSQRSNDDFLRRMLGGELKRDGGTSCNSNDRIPAKGCVGNDRPLPRGEMQGMPGNHEMPNACPASPCTHNCPTQIPAPAIAMVYVPRQCWKSVVEPSIGLSQGTIFTDLVLPLTGKCKSPEKEVKPCRPM